MLIIIDVFFIEVCVYECNSPKPNASLNTLKKFSIIGFKISKKNVPLQKTQKLYYKWIHKLVNKRNNYYDKLRCWIVENACFIAVQNENIIAWKHNKYLT